MDKDYENLNKMPSIFSASEQKYDRYAAAPAVTEGLRHLLLGGNKDKAGEFLLHFNRAVKALGLSVKEFKEIGREVLGDEGLKDRVSYVCVCAYFLACVDSFYELRFEV